MLTFDRTLIERPAAEVAPSPQHHPNSTTNAINNNTESNNLHKSNSIVSGSEGAMGGMGHNNNTSDTNLQQQQQASMAAQEASHNAKPTLRPLSDFLREDDHVYSQDEIKELLDVIHDGNRLAGGERSAADAAGGGGLKPIVRAYGIVGFIRFLDCYYLTLITRRAKVGSIGGNGIYTIKVRLCSFVVKRVMLGNNTNVFLNSLCFIVVNVTHNHIISIGRVPNPFR